MRKNKAKKGAHEGVVIKKEAAPETGTRLTSERMARNLRSLNGSWKRAATESRSSESE